MKPVNNIEFWKDRIHTAKNNSRMHYSVFISNDKLWNDINKKHKEVFDKEIKKTDSVLDLGCGYGRSSQMIECARYVGTDFSPDFINEAKKLYPDKEFVLADMAKLPFADKEFDIGFMVSVKAMIINNLGVEAWQPMEDEAKRVCKKLLVLEYGGGDAGIKNDAEHYEII